MTVQEPDRVLYKRRKYEPVLADSDAGATPPGRYAARGTESTSR